MYCLVFDTYHIHIYIIFVKFVRVALYILYFRQAKLYYVTNGRICDIKGYMNVVP